MTHPKDFASSAIRARVLLLALASVALHTPLPAEAQLRARTGVGWVGAVPDALLGFGAFHTFGEARWGLYADTKLTHDSRSRDPDFESGLTVARVEAEFDPELTQPVHDWEDLWMINLGILREINPDFALVLAGGMARRRSIREYVEFSYIEGETEPQVSRVLFVENEDHTGWEGNFAINGLMRGGENIVFSVGVELAPRTMSLGLFVAFR